MSMVMLINQYSLVAVGLLILVIVPVFIGGLFGSKWAAIAIAVTFISLLGFQLFARTNGDTISNPGDFENALHSGKPVFLELYSNL